MPFAVFFLVLLCDAVMKLMETHEGAAEDAGAKVARVDAPATVEPAAGSGGRF